MPKPSGRLVSINHAFSVLARPEGGARGHDITLSLGYDPAGGDPADPATWPLVEVGFVTRGKVGHGVDHILQELGIKLSRAIQGRDPDTGAPLPGAGAAGYGARG